MKKADTPSGTENETPQGSRTFLEEEEVSRLREGLSRAVHRICPAYLVSHREDFVQVGLLRVMEIRRKSQGERELNTAYLHRVAHSAVVDEIRRRRRRGEVELDDAAADALPTPQPGPAEHAAGHEIHRAVRDCLVQIIPDRRTAVTLHIHGHAVPQIAELLDANLKRTKNLVYRGLDDLRRCLAERGFRHERQRP